MKEIKRIFIIGNGMDISHGYQTSWNELLGKELTSKELQKNFEDEYGKVSILSKELEDKSLWNDFENKIKELAIGYKFFYKKIYADEGYIHSVKEKLKEYFLEWKNMNKEDGESYIKENGLHDNTLTFKNIIIKQIKKMYDGPKKEKIVEYQKLFKIKNYFVINYNYSTFNQDLFKYYEDKECYHIHNKITKDTQNINISNNEKDILLGWYKNKDNLKIEIDWEFLEIDKNDKNKDKLKEFSNLIGNKNDYFNKSLLNEQDIFDSKKIKNYPISFEKIDEAIIIGHSINKNDFDNIHNRIKGLKLNKIKKIYYYGYWNTKDEKNKINDQINHYFKAAGKEVVFNKWNKDNHTYEIG